MTTLRMLVGTGLLMTALPLCAGGFEVESQGARAAGMGGACVAQAIDPTAIFCNPGALALIPKKKGAAIGVSASAFNQSLYQGLPPGPGAGTAAEQSTPRAIQPHAFIALPFGANVVFGTGFYHPFAMHTDWKAPDVFAGRFTSTSSRIDAYDFAPTAGVRVGDSFGFGAGAIYRTSNISAARRLATTAAGVQQEIASFTLKSDTRHSIGWTAGLFVRPAPSFSLGASYRSRTQADANGAGRLTQIKTNNAQFDQLIAATFPFDQDLLFTTVSELPAQTTFGAALGAQAALMLEVDAQRTSWKRVHNFTFVFPSNHTLDTTYALGLQDAWTYRAGLRWQFPTGPQIRLGYSLAKTPLPDAGVGAFFPDSDHTTATAGLGLDWIDVAFGLTTYKQRIVTTSSTSLNGNYRAKSWFAMMTVTK
ncbi:MAG: long-chain fatty acid transport protein [Thermoanaerobaculia bacterium]|jgi:long-chain fatty acid transport protein|nr:long-chain fatty acid transport protein [Thermoanaerobaculia bacterium]